MCSNQFETGYNLLFSEALHTYESRCISTAGWQSKYVKETHCIPSTADSVHGDRSPGNDGVHTEASYCTATHTCALYPGGGKYVCQVYSWGSFVLTVLNSILVSILRLRTS